MRHARRWIIAVLAATGVTATAARADDTPSLSDLATQAGSTQTTLYNPAGDTRSTYTDYPDDGGSATTSGTSSLGAGLGANNSSVKKKKNTGSGIPPSSASNAALQAQAQLNAAALKKLQQQAQAQKNKLPPANSPASTPQTTAKQKMLQALIDATNQALASRIPNPDAPPISRADRETSQALQGLRAGNKPSVYDEFEQALQAALDAGLDVPAEPPPDSDTPPDTNDPNAPDANAYALVTYGDSVEGPPDDSTDTAELAAEISAFQKILAEEDDAGDLTPQVSSIALEPIYTHYIPTPNKNGSSVAPVPTTQVAGPTKVITAPSTQVAGPGKTITAPSTQVAGPSKVITAPSTQVAMPSTQVAGPSKVITAPSTQVQGPSSVMTAPSNQIMGPSTQLVTNAGLETPDEPALCGR